MPGRTFIIELDDEQAERLNRMAGQTNISVRLLLAEIVAVGLAQREAEEARRDADATGGNLDDDIPL